MQKILKRNTYAPTNAPQVCSNCDYSLNKDDNPSVNSLKTFNINSDVDQRQHTDGHNVIVYVLNKDGNPLMPCRPAKARHLLEQNKAKVVTRKPFTIQLLWNCESNTQPVKLGIDAGYKNVGISAVSNKKELFSAEVTLRTDIPKKLQEKAMYRRNKRNRLWHRKPRFLNRAKPKGWLAPSIQHKLDSHIRIVEKIKKLLPISEVIVEVASFDIQKIKNPDITGVEYQQGEQLGFWNLREYVLHRDNHNCQHPNCKHKKDKILVVHHINGKSEGATNRPEELITLHEKCHKEHHSGKNVLPKVKINRFKAETFMTMVHWKLVNILGCRHTYGYITKNNRIKQGLQKSHINDAFIIAGGNNQERCNSHTVKQIRRNNRCLQLNRKGFKPSVRKQHYHIQPGDIIRYQNKEYISKGMHCKGSRVRFEQFSKNVKDIELVAFGKSLQFLHPLKRVVSLEEKI